MTGPRSGRVGGAAVAGLALLLGSGCAAASATAADDDAAPACREPLEPWTRIDLYFGRTIVGGGVVTEEAFRRFLADVVTPRFPDGLSVLDVAGQFRTGAGTIVREPSKLVVIPRTPLDPELL